MADTTPMPVLIDQLKSAYRRQKSIATVVTDVLDWGYDQVWDWRYHRDHAAMMAKIAPEIDRLLRNNLGVVLKLVYDTEEVSEGHAYKQLVSISIVGAGNDPNRILDQENQLAFRQADGPGLDSSGGCRFETNPNCKRTVQYIWKDSYSMKIFKTVEG